jgi:5-dehydro-2-deoxygluconokinase
VTNRTQLDRIHMLAFDHRATLRRMFRDRFDAAAELEAALRGAKRLVLDALLQAREQAAPGLLDPPLAGLLIDEELGADEARAAAGLGITLAMPIERSGADRFTLEYGEAFAERVGRFPVDYAKALVALNPEGDERAYRRELELLAGVSAQLGATGHAFMLEILVPATTEQLGRVDGDVGSFDRDVRPELVCRTVTDCYAAGVRPAVWKLEGLETVADYASVGDACLAGDPGTTCVVLGRGADDARVEHWLRLAAPAEPFRGFAVGRSIWEGALGEHFAGAISREEAVASIARRYLHFTEVYDGAAASPVAAGRAQA